MEDKNKYWYIAIIAAVVLAAWWLTRRQPVSTVQQMPGTLQSGVPSYSPQAQEYNVNLPVLGPSPGLQRLPASNRPQINFDASRGPLNLVYNFPTYNEYAGNLDKSQRLAFALQNKYDLEKQAKLQACGCGGGGCDGGNCGCETCSIPNSGFPDGHGTCMNPNPSFRNPLTNPASLLLLSPAVTSPWRDNLDSATQYDFNGPVTGGGKDPAPSGEAVTYGGGDNPESQAWTSHDPVLLNNDNPYFVERG